MVFLLILILIKERKEFFYLLFGFFFSGLLARGIITEIIRYFFPVARPFIENNVNLLISHSATSSFPSGHAALYFALTTYIFLYSRSILLPEERRFWQIIALFFLLGSFLISFFRVFVGIHWPLDILAGILVGIFSATLVYYFQQKFLNKTKIL